MQKDPQISCPPEEFFRLEELHSPDYQLITPAGKVFSREA